MPIPPQDRLTRILKQLAELEAPQRDLAFGAIADFAAFTHAVMQAVGAGPPAIPPGTAKTTTGSFSCPSCGYSGTATFK